MLIKHVILPFRPLSHRAIIFSSQETVSVFTMIHFAVSGSSVGKPERLMGNMIQVQVVDGKHDSNPTFFPAKTNEIVGGHFQLQSIRIILPHVHSFLPVCSH